MRKRLLLCVVAVALLTPAAGAVDIVWVHQMRGQEGEGTGEVPPAGEGTLEWEDDQWRALLEGAGHNVIVHERFDDLDINPDDVDVVNSGDIVIFSRDSNSGDYNEPDEQEIWAEGVTDPMIIMTPYVIRSNRWDMVEATGILDAGAQGLEPILEALQPDHPVFAGGVLDGNNEAEIWDEELLGPGDNIDFLDALDDGGMLGNGTVLAIEQGSGVPWLVHWEEGVEYYEDSVLGFTAPAPRLYYSVGSDDDPFSWGEKNTTAAGDQILLNAIDWMTGGGGGLDGDFDGSGALDAADINQLTAQAALGENPAEFDLNNDGLVNGGDVAFWVKDLKNSWLGDANLDGEFNSGDFVSVFAFGKFETEQAANWSEGDWDADGRFGSGDFVAAFADGGFEQGPRVATAAVPEPTFSYLMLISCLLWFVRKR